VSHTCGCHDLSRSHYDCCTFAGGKGPRKHCVCCERAYTNDHAGELPCMECGRATCDFQPEKEKHEEPA